MDIGIVGAGPAGLSLAYFLKGSKNTVTVYETLSAPGKKPCAWGLLSGFEEYIPFFKDDVFSKIKGFRIFMDNKLVHDIRDSKTLGYLIDKPSFLQHIAEKVDVKFNTQIVRKGNEFFNKGEKIQHDRFIVASGHYVLPKENTIPAIQYVTDLKVDPEVVDFYFYSDMLGYAWVFPDPKGAKIGIGGDKSVDELRERLKPLVSGQILDFHGARVSDAGIDQGRMESGNYVGEAMGVVYPLTGEGIRPSILSAKVMADTIIAGQNYGEVFKKSRLYWTIQMQARIIRSVKGSVLPLKGLVKILMNSEPNLVMRVAMGDFTLTDLIKMFGRSFI